MSTNRRKSRDDSESAQRERLAKARRERERKARANLAAKARGEEPAGGDAPEESEEKPPGVRSGDSPEGAGKPEGAKRGTSAAEERGKREEGRREERDGKTAPAKRDDRKARPAAKGRRAPAKDAGGRKRAAGAVATARRMIAEARARIVAWAPRAGHLILRLLLVLFAALFAAIALVLNLALAVWAFCVGPLRAGIGRLDRLVRAASRAVTPSRVLVAVTAGALLLLALSQFADYRSISVGNDTYAPGIQTVAPAPVAETDPTGSAHGYALVPLAAIGLLVLAAAVVTGRRRLCGLLALIGLGAVLLALLNDRATGLDTGDRALAYEGVAATLVGGFYAQIAAGLVLIGSSLLLYRLGTVPAGNAARRRKAATWGRPRRRRAPAEGARA